jgi:hypothetical protein
MELLENKTGSSRMESWPVREPHQVPDAGRGLGPKDTLGGATQRISSPKRMEIFAHTKEPSPITAANCDLISVVYDFPPPIVYKDEDIWNIFPPLSIGDNTSSSTGETPMTSMSIFEPPDSIPEDGIGKKNARFEIPAERNLHNIDTLIMQTQDEAERKELKQQKRLLRNRQAAYV